MKKLTFENFKQDESGYWCIEVKRGKGGKYQLQRILPEDVEFIKRYFKTESTDRVFKASDFSPAMDYHHLRALQAQKLILTITTFYILVMKKQMLITPIACVAN